jgi:hypothetical protein
MTITVCALPRRHSVSAMKAGPPIPSLLESVLWIMERDRGARS